MAIEDIALAVMIISLLLMFGVVIPWTACASRRPFLSKELTDELATNIKALDEACKNQTIENQKIGK